MIKENIARMLKVNEDQITICSDVFSGRSNQLFKFKYLDKYYTYRLPFAVSNELVNRKDEKTNIKIALDQGVGKEIVAFNTTSGELISNYYEGKCINAKSKEDIREIAFILKKLHNLGGIAADDYNWENRLMKYEKLIENTNVKYFKLKDMVLSRKYLLDDKMVFCHCDSQPSNFIKTSNGIVLGDFEYSNNNSIYYDIACFGAEKFEDAFLLLKEYIDEPTNIDYINLYLYRCIQLLQWYNVAVHKDKYNLSKSIEVDLRSFAISCLDRVEKYLVEVERLKNLIK